MGLRCTLFATVWLAATTVRADVYVSGFNSGGVYRFDETSGAPVGGGVFIAPGSGGLAQPHGILRLVDGTFVVASAGTDEVLRYDADGGFLSRFIANGQNGVPPGTLDYPVDLVLSPGGVLLVTSQLNDRVLRFAAADGAFLGDACPPGTIDGPSGVAVDASNGTVFCAGRFGNHVRRLGAAGVPSAAFSPAVFGQPFGVALDADGGRLFVADGNANAVRAVHAETGATLATLTGGLSLPVGVRIDLDGNVYVASYNGDRVARFDATTGAAGSDVVTAAAAAAAGLDGPNFFAFIADPTPLEAWRLTYFGTLEEAGGSANGADPDHDGLANVLEFAVDGRPDAPTASPFETALDNGGLLLRVHRAPVAGVVWAAEASADLVEWSPEDMSVVTDTPALYEVRDALSAGAGGRRFLRFTVRPE